MNTWRERWQSLRERERLALLVGAALLTLLLLFLVALRPAWHVLQQGPARLALLDTQLERAQRAAAEAQALRQVPRVDAAQARAALQAATTFLGAQAQLSLEGERATLRLQGVTPEALLRWLGEARRAARARPLETQLERQDDGQLRGVLVLALGDGP